MKYDVIYRLSGRIEKITIEADKIKIMRQFNSLLTATFLTSFGDIKYIIANVEFIERKE